MKKMILAIAAVAVFTLSGTAMADSGASVFASKCLMCHGSNGSGSAMGPKLAGTDFIKGDADAIKGLITSGVPMAAKKYPNYPMAMPKVALGDAQLDAVVTYLKGL